MAPADATVPRGEQLMMETVISRCPLGIGMHSYTEAWRPAGPEGGSPRFGGALDFLEYAHSIGAAGVQVALNAAEEANPAPLRSRIAGLGIRFEGQLSLPRAESDVPRFETTARAIRVAGATIARTAVLSGRRYETFRSDAEFMDFSQRGWTSLTLAEPVLRRHRLRLAVENHKDWLAPELAGILRRLASEWVGACVDLGNNLALLEDPYAVVEELAPFAVSTHIKDMALRDDADGLLLAEVPLGEGSLDLPRLVRVLRRANPEVALMLEMITRDPLRIPCLTQAYWATFETVPAVRLAAAWARVREAAGREPLPRTSQLPAVERLRAEDDNVRRCLAWATRHAAAL